MEIIRENNVPERRGRGVEGSNLYLGLVLIAAGAVWMLYNLDAVPRGVFHLLFSWEMLLVAVGGYLLSTRRWAAGGVVTAAGVVFLLSRYIGFYIPVSDIILPLVLIALGVAFLVPRR